MLDAPTIDPFEEECLNVETDKKHTIKKAFPENMLVEVAKVLDYIQKCT
jgi:hypothetical protein